MMQHSIDPAAVAFDIDGVVADTMTLFLDIAREHYGINGVRYDDITCYGLTECVDIPPATIDAIIARILDGSYRPSLKAVEGAPQVLERIGRQSRSVLLVTARPHVGPMQEWTSKILPLPPDWVDIVATGSFEHKAEVLRQRDRSVFVEDRLETCFHLQSAGITPVVFKQPWNREPHPFWEVASWQELSALIAFR